MLLELDLPLLDRASVRRGKAEVSLHGDDAGAHAGCRAGAAEDVDVVAGRLLDDLQPRTALPDQLAHERERAAVQKAPAQGDRRAVGHEAGQLGERHDFGNGHADHGSVEQR